MTGLSDELPDIQNQSRELMSKVRANLLRLSDRIMFSLCSFMVLCSKLIEIN